IGANATELGLAPRNSAPREAARRSRVPLLGMGEGGRAVAEGVWQRRCRGLGSRRRAAGRQRAEGVAVIALAPADESGPPRLADFQKILPRHLQRGFDRFRAAAYEIRIGEAARLVSDELVGQRLGRIPGKEARMGVGQFVGLTHDRLEHARMLVPEARYGGATGAIEHLTALRVDEPHTVPARGNGRHLAQAAVQDAAARLRHRDCGAAHAHDRTSSATYCAKAASLVSVWRSRPCALSPPSANAAAASACTVATAPVRLGKNPGAVAASNSSRWPAPSAMGAVGASAS